MSFQLPKKDSAIHREGAYATLVNDCLRGDANSFRSRRQRRSRMVSGRSNFSTSWSAAKTAAVSQVRLRQLGAEGIRCLARTRWAENGIFSLEIISPSFIASLPAALPAVAGRQAQRGISLSLGAHHLRCRRVASIRYVPAIFLAEHR